MTENCARNNISYELFVLAVIELFHTKKSQGVDLEKSGLLGALQIFYGRIGKRDVLESDPKFFCGHGKEAGHIFWYLMSHGCVSVQVTRNGTVMVYDPRSVSQSVHSKFLKEADIDIEGAQGALFCASSKIDALLKWSNVGSLYNWSISLKDCGDTELKDNAEDDIIFTEDENGNITFYVKNGKVHDGIGRSKYLLKKKDDIESSRLSSEVQYAVDMYNLLTKSYEPSEKQARIDQEVFEKVCSVLNIAIAESVSAETVPSNDMDTFLESMMRIQVIDKEISELLGFRSTLLAYVRNASYDWPIFKFIKDVMHIGVTSGFCGSLQEVELSGRDLINGESGAKLSDFIDSMQKLGEVHEEIALLRGERVKHEMYVKKEFEKISVQTFAKDILRFCDLF